MLRTTKLRRKISIALMRESLKVQPKLGLIFSILTKSSFHERSGTQLTSKLSYPARTLPISKMHSTIIIIIREKNPSTVWTSARPKSKSNFPLLYLMFSVGSETYTRLAKIVPTFWFIFSEALWLSRYTCKRMNVRVWLAFIWFVHGVWVKGERWFDLHKPSVCTQPTQPTLPHHLEAAGY